MTARWKSEKAKVGQGAQLRETLDRLRAELAAAQRAGDLGRASRSPTARFRSWNVS